MKSSELEKVLDLLVTKMEKEDFDQGKLERLCGEYPQYANDLKETWRLWNELDEIETPEIEVSGENRFLQTLSEFKMETSINPPQGKYVHISTVFRWAAIFIVGLGLGLFINSGYFNNSVNDRPEFNTRSQMITQLTSGESASNRLTAIQNIKGLVNPEDQIFEALFTTLINDPNVNVRLSSIEAMLHFIDSPRSRELLIKALTYQDDPIVQITLAEVIIKLQENGSSEEIKKLIEANELDLEVKMHLQETMNL